jgi:hypothetical protein
MRFRHVCLSKVVWNNSRNADRIGRKFIIESLTICRQIPVLVEIGKEMWTRHIKTCVPARSEWVWSPLPNCGEHATIMALCVHLVTCSLLYSGFDKFSHDVKCVYQLCRMIRTNQVICTQVDIEPLRMVTAFVQWSHYVHDYCWESSVNISTLRPFCRL